MTYETFRHLLDLYGADLSRWPRDQIAAARRLIDTHPGADTLFSEALQLDHLLRLAEPALPSKEVIQALEVRILQEMQSSFVIPSVLGSFRPSASWMPFGGMALMALILGFLTGAPAFLKHPTIQSFYSVGAMQDDGDLEL